jgi:hypothetical protein
MTVTPVIGSSLEDVWGQDFTKKKKRSKRTGEPSCDTYSKTPTQFDDIMDVYSYNENEPYNKTKFSRTQKHLVDTDAEDRELEDHVVNVDSKDPTSYIKGKTKEFYNNYESINEFLVKNRDKLLQHHNSISNINNKEKQYLDLSMYIFSGIALIFILEQFISIGIALGTK